MGGCRCVYRSCQNSTTATPGLHYFHFPVRDPARCELWIKNAQKPDFRNMEKYKLRNKVVCSIHFEDKCFTNERHDRLIHSAVPTLGFEDDVEEPSDSLQSENQSSSQSMTDDNIMLIPIDEDNTKFTLPNVEFSGMSYTIFDDAVIPTSKIEEVIIKEMQNKPKPKELVIKSVVTHIKHNNLPPLKKAPIVKNDKHQDISQFSVFAKDNQIVNNTTKERSNYNIQTYSVSLNGDVSLEPSNILPDVVVENNEQTPIQNNIESVTQSILDQNSSQSTDNISLQAKADNEYMMSLNPVTFIENINNDNSQENATTIQEVQLQTEESQESVQPNNIETDYIQMIQNNTKQIQLLKRLVRKQTRLNRIMLQRKQMPSYKKKLSKLDLIDSLKDCIKPSLLAILKLELLPVDDVVLSDQEEKFITDLYTENPECYNLLRTKFNWNLPTSEQIEEPQENMQCE